MWLIGKLDWMSILAFGFGFDSYSQIGLEFEEVVDF